MKKIILSIALFVGFIMVSSAQTSATGDVPQTKPKPVIETATPEPTVKNTNGTETDKPAATTSTTTTTTTNKKSTKKSCCKTKSDACCKKKTEAIKED